MTIVFPRSLHPPSINKRDSGRETNRRLRTEELSPNERARTNMSGNNSPGTLSVLRNGRYVACQVDEYCSRCSGAVPSVLKYSGTSARRYSKEPSRSLLAECKSGAGTRFSLRSEEHTSELQSLTNLVCR